MKKLLLLFMGLILLLGVLTGCTTNGSTGQTKPYVTKTAWVKTLVAAPEMAGMTFKSVATDKNGNVYGVGYGYIGGGPYDFGNGVSVTCTDTGVDFPVIVKYNGSGVAQWARITSKTPADCEFRDVVVADDGSVYAVGYIEGTGTFNFGNSVTATGKLSPGPPTAVIVKYNSSGVTQWAITPVTCPDDSKYYSIVVDSTGNIYVAGYIMGGSGSFDFGNSVTLNLAVGSHAVLLKYNSSGVAQWIKSTVSGSYSQFLGLDIDSTNNLFVAAKIYNTGVFDFGNDVTVDGSYSAYNMTVLKYDSNGLAQWATSTTAGSNISEFVGISIDSLGNSYAVGFITGKSTYSFGTVNVSGSYSGENLVVAKFDDSGVAQWAKSATGLSGDSIFNSVAVDAKDNVYVGGYLTGTATVDFGNSITAAGAYASGENIIAVRYDSDGAAQWVRGVSVAPHRSSFDGIVVDRSGNLYGAGEIVLETTAYTFNDNITTSTITGIAVGSSLLVKYE